MRTTTSWIEAIDGAAFDDTRFDAVVTALARHVGAATGTFWLVDPGACAPPLSANHDIRPGGAFEYAHHWHLLDPWGARARQLGGMRTGWVAIGSELADRRDVEHSAFYNEWAHEHGMSAMLSAIVVGAPGPDQAPRSLASFYRPAGEPEFDDDDRRALGAALPRLQAALGLRELWQRARRLAGATGAAFDQLDAGGFVLDAASRIVAANPRGEALLRQPGAAHHQRGRLQAVGQRSTPTLAAALARSFAEGCAQKLVVQWSGPPSLLTRAHVMPLPAAASLPPSRPDHALLVVELPPSPPADEWVALVADLYQLTAAEARVATLLADGIAHAEAARRLGIAVTTLRTHARNAMAKMDVQRSAELARLLGPLRV